MSSSESDGDEAAFEDIRCYFSKREWSDLSQYEKKSLSSSKRNYEAMVKAGLDPRKPKFMRSDEETPAKSKATQQPTNRPKPPKAAKLEVAVGPPRTSRRIRTQYHYENPDKENGGAGAQDEDLLFCDECNNAWMGDCPVHGQLNCISDVEVAADDPNRDTRSAPSVLVVQPRTVAPSQRHDQDDDDDDDEEEDDEEEDGDDEHRGGERTKMGVWAKARIRKRTRFGPYEGDIMPIDRDGDPANLPNWMHHVRRLPRRDCAVPNLRPFQYAGRLYFRTLADVPAGTELVVSFKPQPASGVDSPRLRCEHCDRCFECPLLRAQHQRSSAHCAAQARQRRRALVDLQRERLRRVAQQHQLSNSPTNSDSSQHRRRGCIAPTDAETLQRFRDQIRQEWRKYHQNQEGEWLAQEDVASGPYSCRKCGDQFRRTATLHAHMRDKHPFNAAGLCGCRDCADELVSAAPSFLESLAFPCSTCGADFQSSDDLRAHVLVVHVATKRFRCDACGDSFGRKAVLLDHVRVKHQAAAPRV